MQIYMPHISAALKWTHQIQVVYMMLSLRAYGSYIA